MFFRSTVGKKWVMALTGLAMVGFIVGHLIGNLKVFQGIDPHTGKYYIDVYSEHLRILGEPLFGEGQVLWMARIGLLVVVILHILSAVQLTMMSRAARPVAYQSAKPQVTTYAARTMRWGGIIIFLYIVYHILHLTYGTVHFEGFEHGKVYANIISGFKVPYVTGIYLVAMSALCFHLYHGTWSVFQTFGVDASPLRKKIQCGAKAFAIIIFLGYASIPVSVQTGCLKEPAPSSHLAVELADEASSEVVS